MPNDPMAIMSVGWRIEPLCRRYLGVQFQPLTMQVGERGTVRTALWAIGLLDQHESDILGSWFVPNSGQVSYQRILGEIKSRGVEEVDAFVSDRPMQFRKQGCIAFARATVLPSLWNLLQRSFVETSQRDRRTLANTLGTIVEQTSVEAARDALRTLAASPLGAAYPDVVGRWSTAVKQLEPMYALSARLRRVLRLGDGIVKQLHESLNRAVARHGSFADEDAAMSFLAAALQRAERRLDRRGMDRAPTAGMSVVRQSKKVQTLARFV